MKVVFHNSFLRLNLVTSSKVSQELAKQETAEIKNLLETIAIYQNNRRRLDKRAALEGGEDFAPINVINQLRAQEDAILEKSKELAFLLDKLTEQTP